MTLLHPVSKNLIIFFSQVEKLVRFLGSNLLESVNIAIVELPEGASRLISKNTESIMNDTPYSSVLAVIGGAAIYSGLSHGICALCASTLFSETFEKEVLFRLAFSCGITSYFARFCTRVSRFKSRKPLVHPFDNVLTPAWRYSN